MLEIIEGWSVVIVIIATIINVYFVYRNWEIKKPVIDFEIDKLPPYSSDDEKSTITLKNVGNKGTEKNPEVLVSCSWMPNTSYKLNFPSNNYNLEPSESMTWKLRIDNNPLPNSTVIIKVTSYYSWEYHEQIS